MQHITRRHALRIGTAAAGVLGLPASAQDFVGPSHAPAHPLRIIVPFPPGGRTGFVARRLVVALHEVLGETVELEHRIEPPLFEITAFSRLPANSRTLLLAMVRLPRKGVFSADEDNAMLERLTPIAVVAREPLALVMSKHRAQALQIDHLAQLMRYIRQHPGKLTISTGADGNSSHLAAELFKSMSQTYITRIIGPRNVPDLSSVISGTTDLMFENLHLLKNAIRANAVRLMGIAYSTQQGTIDETSLLLKKPVPFLHTEPSLADYEMYDYHTVFAPPGLAADKADLIYRSCAQAVSQTGYRSALQAAMALPSQDGSTAFLALEDQEEQRWRRARARW